MFGAWHRTWKDSDRCNIVGGFGSEADANRNYFRMLFCSALVLEFRVPLLCAAPCYQLEAASFVSAREQNGLAVPIQCHNYY